jgi:LCP family protein required for cell wall assembly
VPRVNVLLIGSDADSHREGIRPDTLIVASIDTRSGDTVLFSLPRNLQRVPFPAGSRAAAAYPRGFTCYNAQAGANTDCLLNGIWEWAERNRSTFYPRDRQPGLTATVQAAEAVTGLRIDNFAMVDMRGFRTLVDAIGGVTLEVPRDIPINGRRTESGAQVGVTGYIRKGVRRLNGFQALWFARSRSDSDDFDRMRRQRCVLGALVEQADPLAVAAAFPRLARAARENVRTDIPLADVDAWVTLALRVKDASVRSLPFTSAVLNTANPRFSVVHALVRQALRPPDRGAASGTPSAAPTGRDRGKARDRSPSAGRSPAEPADRAVEVRQVC